MDVKILDIAELAILVSLRVNMADVCGISVGGMNNPSSPRTGLAKRNLTQ